SFGELLGWAGDDHAAAFRAFLASATRIAEHPPRARPLGPDPETLAALAARALALGPGIGAGAARAFFEDAFRPHAVGRPAEAFFTGYYEPEVRGARQRGAGFEVPLYRRPADLVEIDETSRPA